MLVVYVTGGSCRRNMRRHCMNIVAVVHNHHHCGQHFRHLYNVKPRYVSFTPVRNTPRATTTTGGRQRRRRHRKESTQTQTQGEQEENQATTTGGAEEDSWTAYLTQKGVTQPEKLAQAVQPYETGRSIQPSDQLQHYNEAGLPVLPSGNSLLDASQEELDQLGFSGIYGNQQLLDTVPDGLPDTSGQQQSIRGLTGPMEGHRGGMLQDESDASDATQQELQRLRPTRKQMQKAEANDEETKDNKVVQQQQEDSKEKELRGLLPEGFDNWRQVAQAKSRKRIKKQQRFEEDVKMKMLKEKIPPPKAKALYPHQQDAGISSRQEKEKDVRSKLAALAANSSVRSEMVEPEPCDQQHDEPFKAFGYSVLGNPRGKQATVRQERMGKHLQRLLAQVLSSTALQEKSPDLCPGGLPVEITNVRVSADLQQAYVHWTLPVPYFSSGQDAHSVSEGTFTSQEYNGPRRFGFPEPTPERGWEHLGSKWAVNTGYGYGYPSSRGARTESHYPSRKTSLTRHIDRIKEIERKKSKRHILEEYAPQGHGKGDKRLSGHRARVARRRLREAMEENLSHTSPPLQSLFSRVQHALNDQKGYIQSLLKPHLTTRHVPRLIFFRDVEYDELETSSTQGQEMSHSTEGTKIRAKNSATAETRNVTSSMATEYQDVWNEDDDSDSDTEVEYLSSRG